MQSDRLGVQKGDSENTEGIREIYRKELENIRMSQEKIENSFPEMQTELKAVKSRMKKYIGTN